MIQFDAHYDGEHICPDEPVSLPENIRLRVIVVPAASLSETEATPPQSPLGFFGSIEAEHGLIDGPADWATELDHYLYGTEKRGSDAAS